MKRYILIAAAALMGLVSCQEKEPIEPSFPEPEKPADFIELSDPSGEVSGKGGKAFVHVTSSADWTLAAKENYDWVTPSAVEGSDNETVTFTVAENFDADRTAVFTFTVGEMTADFKVISYAGEKPVAPALSLLSEADRTIGFEGGALDILVSYNKDYHDIKTSVSEGAETWCEFKVVLEGVEDNQAKIMYEVKNLEGLEDRNAVITVTVNGLEPLTVNLLQTAKHVLSSEITAFAASRAGDELIVPIYTNIDYEITIGSNWISHLRKDGTSEVFKIDPLAKGLRSTTITFTEKNPEEGVEPLKHIVTVSQQSTLVSAAVQMDGARLYTSFEGDKVLDNYNTFTIEFLVKGDSFDDAGSTLFTNGSNCTFYLGDPAGGSVKNGCFLLDANGTQVKEFPFFAKPMVPGTWYHVCVSFENTNFRIFINGELKVNQGVKDHQLPIFVKGKQFSFGGTTFKGMITECRIWNIALFEAQLAEKNHYYDVDPASDGLMTYWKFNEGTEVIKNIATGKDALPGFDLHGELNGAPGISWKPAALPAEN